MAADGVWAPTSDQLTAPMTEPFADRILRADARQYAPGTDLFDVSHFNKIRQRLGTAKRFVFTPSACKAIADIVCDRPVEIARHVELAKPSYESMWLELPLFGDHWRDPPLWGEFSGFIIDHDVVQGVNELPASQSEHYPHGMIHATWDRYHLCASWSRDEQDEFFKSLAINDWRRWVFGNIATTTTWQGVPDEPLRQILDRVSIDLSGSTDQFLVDMKERGTVSKVTLGGNVLIPLTAMILLNTPPAIHEVHVPYTRRFIAGKHRQLREHTRIEINLSTDSVVRYISDQIGQNDARRRRHEVRGHFCHNAVARAAACFHSWVQDDARHWHCAECGGRRWWKDQHDRGDETLGSVRRNYTVR